jgi:type IV pilus assembly protein PilN
MRININLASQPYEIARQYMRRMTMLVAALGLAAVVLVGYIVYQRAYSRAINRQLAVVQGQIGGLDHEEAQARATLNKPDNRAIADQSEFLNDLFARKSLSWTRIFTEMEKIVPPNLHVVSMKPEYTKTNDLVLRITVATDSRDRAVELVRHMEKSSHFRQPQVVAETVVANTSEQTGTSGNIQFDVAAIYVPGVPDRDETPVPGTATDGNGAAPSQRPPAPVKKALGTAASPLPANSNAAASNVPPNMSAAQSPPVAPRREREH